MTTQETLDRVRALKALYARKGKPLTPAERVRLWYAKPRLQALLSALPRPRTALP